MTTAKTPTEELEVVGKNLLALKLKHWQSDLSTDLEGLLPESRKIILSHLTKATGLELSERHTQSINRRIELAKFIRIQTIDQFDFGYNVSTKEIKSSYVKLYDKIRDGHIPRAVFVGNTSLGKTHLARSLGYAACQADLSVMFTKAAQIVNALATAKATHTLDRELKKYLKPQLLICDELGYVTMDLEASNLFFQVVSERHDRGLGTIVTTNFAFGHWNQIFAADSTAVVIVERLTAEADVFYLEGESYTQNQRKNKSKK
jgi:DNA replication protein DnaC